jgi:hypothetical protein
MRSSLYVEIEDKDSTRQNIRPSNRFGSSPETQDNGRPSKIGDSRVAWQFPKVEVRICALYLCLVCTSCGTCQYF